MILKYKSNLYKRNLYNSGQWKWIWAVTNMYYLGFSRLIQRPGLEAFSWKNIKPSFKVYDCVSEHGGIISILQTCEMAVAKLDSCGLLVDAHN